MKIKRFSKYLRAVLEVSFKEMDISSGSLKTDPLKKIQKIPNIVRFDSKMYSDDEKHVLGIPNDVRHDQKPFWTKVRGRLTVWGTAYGMDFSKDL